MKQNKTGLIKLGVAGFRTKLVRLGFTKQLAYLSLLTGAVLEMTDIPQLRLSGFVAMFLGFLLLLLIDMPKIDPDAYA